MDHRALGEAKAMTDSESRGSSSESTTPAAFQSALDSYLRDKGKGSAGESGQYRRNAERVLQEFLVWCGQCDVRTFDDLDADVLREYVSTELLDPDLSPRTIHKYYDYLSAWVGWCQREGLVPEHYGVQERAREPLPDKEARRKEQRQQTWLPDERRAILLFVDDRAHEAIDEDGSAALGPVRDRALVYLLAYSGVRGAEFLAVNNDDRRDGARWSDMSDDYATLTVLSKNQDWTQRAIPTQARPALERWERVLNPTEDWPLFPTLHLPSLYDRLRDAGVETTGLSGHDEVFVACRENDVTPPSLATDGARRVMQRLTDAADLDVDGGYLKLHGARRGVGRTLTIEQGVSAAADQLDNSARVVEEAYSDVLAKERAERTSEAFEDHDG
ncbi:hypothetical protein [Salinibaculum salinum]|uniref:tyrosine-type recombinase/integrase n=1 Tax=Salinibaculum salinum TaxID=3131996 RepID=UPI0030EE31D7